MFTNLILFFTIFFISINALDFNIEPGLSIIPCNDSWKSNWKNLGCASSNSSHILFKNLNDCALSRKNIIFKHDAISILDFVWAIDNENHLNIEYGFSSTWPNIHIFTTLGVGINGFNELRSEYSYNNYPLNIRNGTIFVKIAVIYKNHKLNAMMKINDEAWKQIFKPTKYTIAEGSIVLINVAHNENQNVIKIRSLGTYFFTQDNKIDILENNEKILDVIVDKINSEKSKCDSELNNLNTVRMVTDLLTSNTPDSKSYTLSNNLEESVTPLFNTTNCEETSEDFNNDSDEMVTVLPKNGASYFNYTNIILMIFGICFSVQRNYF